MIIAVRIVTPCGYGSIEGDYCLHIHGKWKYRVSPIIILVYQTLRCHMPEGTQLFIKFKPHAAWGKGDKYEQV